MNFNGSSNQLGHYSLHYDYYYCSLCTSVQLTSWKTCPSITLWLLASLLNSLYSFSILKKHVHPYLYGPLHRFCTIYTEIVDTPPLTIRCLHMALSVTVSCMSIQTLHKVQVQRGCNACDDRNYRWIIMFPKEWIVMTMTCHVLTAIIIYAFSGFSMEQCPQVIVQYSEPSTARFWGMMILY